VITPPLYSGAFFGFYAAPQLAADRHERGIYASFSQSPKW
jgi:hypothetical protein